MSDKMKNYKYIYEIYYRRYDWHNSIERIGVFLNKKTANDKCNELNEKYWNNRKPYYVEETELNKIELNYEFYKENIFK